MANEIDILMDLDPLELAQVEGGIDGIVAIMRRHRALAEQGIKPKKEAGPKLKIDLVMLGLKAPEEEIKRRV